jgi:hypothetical protein
MKKIKIKSADKLTFNNALLSAEYLIKQEHPNKLCKSCQKTLRLLKELKKELNNQAIGDNLVWDTFKYADK